jgi:hypothetical protein
MKNPLKQIAFLLALVGVMSTSVAQQPTKLVKEKVVETYSRLSITFFMVLFLAEMRRQQMLQGI